MSFRNNNSSTVKYEIENHNENRTNKIPEYHVPILIQNDSKINQSEKLTDKKNYQQSSFIDEHDGHHYIKVGNVTIPEEFFSPEAQGLWDWINKGIDWVQNIFNPKDDHNNKNNQNNQNNQNNNHNNGGGVGGNIEKIVPVNGQIPQINNIFNISFSANK